MLRKRVTMEFPERSRVLAAIFSRFFGGKEGGDESKVQPCRNQDTFIFVNGPSGLQLGLSRPISYSPCFEIVLSADG